MRIEFTPPYPRSLYVCWAFGFLTPFETMYLISLSRSLPDDAIIINIGSGAGTSGLALYEAHHPLDEDKWKIGFKPATIYTLDINPGGPEGGMENEHNAFKSVGLKPDITHQILMDSKRVGAEWQHGPVDLVFVDGDHSRDGATGDILAWRNHVKPGGLMVFHDYGGPWWGEVKLVVDENMTDWIPLPVVDRIAAFRKP